MNSIYVVGGQQRELRTLLSDQQWYNYEQGLIIEVEPESAQLTQRVAYVSPPEVCPDEDPPILFKSATHVGDLLYACTQTEVLIYQMPQFVQLSYLSLPCFNDVHHVRPTPEGNLLIADSGLELVLEVTLAGEVLREWNVLGENTWAALARNYDYRKINLKPHRSHPNYVFYIGDEPWATRFHQKDAVSLLDPSKQILIGGERVHDGVVHGDYVYFTSVDGTVIVANPRTLQVEERISLGQMHESDTLLGWCRGLLFDGPLLWVGFSRIRATKFRENIGWISRGFKEVSPTHVACYDVERRCCIAEIDLEPQGLHAVFSIHPAL